MIVITFKNFESDVVCGNCNYHNNGSVLNNYTAELNEERTVAILKPFSTVCAQCDALISKINFDSPLNIKFDEADDDDMEFA